MARDVPTFFKSSQLASRFEKFWHSSENANRRIRFHAAAKEFLERLEKVDLTSF
jgi:hypothetical protein